MGYLWGATFESGLHDGGASDAEKQRRFAAQDTWEGLPSVSASIVEDDDATPAGDVGGAGRYALHPVNVGLGDVIDIDTNCQYEACAGDTIYWTAIIQVNAMSEVGVVSGDTYRCLLFSLKAGGGTATEPYFGLSCESEGTGTTPKYHWEVDEWSVAHGRTAVHITGTTGTYTMGTTTHQFVQVEYKPATTTVDGHVKLYVDGSQEGLTHTITAADPAPVFYDEAPFLYRTSLIAGGKSTDHGINYIFSEFHGTDNGGSNGLPASLPPTSMSSIAHHVTAAGPTDNWTASTGAGIACVVNNENNDDPGDGDYAEPDATDKQQQEWEIADKNGTPVLYAVRLLAALENTTDVHEATMQIGSGGNDTNYGAFGYATAGTDPPFAGITVPQTPEATPADWDVSDIDTLIAGMQTTGTSQNKVYEYYVILIGTGLTSPAKATDCAIASTHQRAGFALGSASPGIY